MKLWSSNGCKILSFFFRPRGKCPFVANSFSINFHRGANPLSSFISYLRINLPPSCYHDHYVVKSFFGENINLRKSMIVVFVPPIPRRKRRSSHGRTGRDVIHFKKTRWLGFVSYHQNTRDTVHVYRRTEKRRSFFTPEQHGKKERNIYLTVAW